MKILVIGAAGQLARALGEAAENTDFEVIRLGRPDLDIEMPGAFAEALAGEAPQLVINTAAYTDVDGAETDETRAFALNAQAAGTVAQECQRRDIPLLHISTDFVFDGKKDRPYTESDAPNPINVYGRSKLEGERLVAENCVRHLIIRTAWIYSPFGQNFVKTMLRLTENNNEIDVVSDQIGNPTYAPDLAKCLLAMAQKILANPAADFAWGIYHAAGSGHVSRSDFAREIFRQSQLSGGPAASVRDISSDQFPAPCRRPLNSRLDCTKLAQDFDLQLPDWRDSLRACISRLNNPDAKSSGRFQAGGQT